MTTLAEFFGALSKQEGKPTNQLIAPWDQDDVKSTGSAFARGMIGPPIEFWVRSDISDPAPGYRVEHVVAFWDDACPGILFLRVLAWAIRIKSCDGPVTVHSFHSN